MESIETLSPLDCLFTDPNYGSMNVSVFFRTEIDQTRLKEAWMALATSNPLLLSVLSRKARSYSFIAAHSEPWFSFAQLPEDTDPMDPNDILPHFDAVASPDDSHLCKLKLVHGRSGSGLFLSIAHCLGDGMSLMLVLCNLARAYAGLPVFPWSWKRSHFEEVIESLPSGERTATKSFSGMGSKPSLPSEKVNPSKLNPIPIETLKSYQEEFPGFSVFELISALILKRRAAETASDTLTAIVPLDLRRRISGLSPFYFGNAVKTEIASIPTVALKEETIGAIADRVRNLIRQFDSTAFKEGYRQLRSTHRNFGPELVSKMRVTQPNSLLLTDLTTVPSDLSFQGSEPDVINFLSPYPFSACIVRFRGSYFYQIGIIRA